MATITRNNFAADKNSFQSSDEFELELKTRLKWNKRQWSSAGENGSRLNKLCSSLNFWKHKLKPAMEESSLVFTIYNVDRDIKLDLNQIIAEIESLAPNVEVRGVSEFRNPRYLCVHFENKEVKHNIESLFKMIENSYVVLLSWALGADSNITTLKVHWLPLTFDINVIKKELEKYATCVEQERINISLMSGRELPSGKITFKVLIKKDVKVESIPHLTNIANMEALITIPGRQPLCLNCEEMGHISKDCKLRFCQVCNQMKVKDHICKENKGVRSFADVAREQEERIDPDDWGNKSEPNAMGLNTEKKLLLSQEINGIKEKIQKLEEEDLAHINLRLDKKRDAQGFSNSNKRETEEGLLGKEILLCGDAVQSSSSESEEEEKEEAMSLDALGFLQDNDGNGKQEAKKEHFKMANKKKSNKTTAKHDVIDPITWQTRSYGKPVYDNARRRKQEEEFNKLTKTREFVFDD